MGDEGTGLTRPLLTKVKNNPTAKRSDNIIFLSTRARSTTPTNSTN